MPSADMYRHIWNSSCIPCRVNAFHDASGIGTSDHYEQTKPLDYIGCCKSHHSNSFCFNCLVDSLPHAYDPEFVRRTDIDNYGRWAGFSMMQNYDFQYFEYAKTVCHQCRWDRLSKEIISNFGGGVEGERAVARIRGYPQGQNALREFHWGNTRLVQQTISFISEQMWFIENDPEYQGFINDKFVHEKARFSDAYGRITQEHEMMASNIATSPEYLGLLRSRRMALYLRERILSGLWISPYDQEDQEQFVLLVSLVEEAVRRGHIAAHPYFDFNEAWANEWPMGAIEIPPCSSADFWVDMRKVFTQQFRTLIGPAIKNCVARVEAAAEIRGLDLHRLLMSVELDDLLTPAFLLAPEAWAKNPYDWASRYRNVFTSAQSETGSSSPKSGSHGSSEPPSSVAGDRPSPSTTMRTTPSPGPEATDSKGQDGNTLHIPRNSSSEAMVSPVSTSSATFVMLQAFSARKTAREVIEELAAFDTSPVIHEQIEPYADVPKVPHSASFLGRSARNILLHLWSEAVEPLMVCQCSICFRAEEAVKAKMRAMEEMKEREKAARQQAQKESKDRHGQMDTEELDRYLAENMEPVNNGRGITPGYTDDEFYSYGEEEDDEDDEDLDWDDYAEESDYEQYGEFQESVVAPDGRRTTSYVINSNQPAAPTVPVQHQQAGTFGPAPLLRPVVAPAPVSIPTAPAHIPLPTAPASNATLSAAARMQIAALNPQLGQLPAPAPVKTPTPTSAPVATPIATHPTVPMPMSSIDPRLAQMAAAGTVAASLAFAKMAQLNMLATGNTQNYGAAVAPPVPPRVPSANSVADPRLRPAQSDGPNLHLSLSINPQLGATTLTPTQSSTRLPLDAATEASVDAGKDGSAVTTPLQPAPRAPPQHSSAAYATSNSALRSNKRRSRSPSPSPSPTPSSLSTSSAALSDLTTNGGAGMERRASKRSRSKSLERPPRVRVRDDEDVGGPDGEIVNAPDMHGHGRKRVKSFDGNAPGATVQPLATEAIVSEDDGVSLAGMTLTAPP
ncbi:hypothetical protein DL93DRAFT_2084474, partial [Clavulina sp. PMI_390]